ncbi:MAG: hypothetical protein H7327_05300 [Herminiimonas sp.]|nr:hypothetical protein [Herminiimonas sp.]
MSASAASVAADLDFDRTFSIKGEAPQSHYRATYGSEGKAHEVEIWRDGDRRLKRRTDDAIETFVFMPANEVEWRMVVLDLKRRIRTDIDRTNLIRIGHFTDWFSLSHSLMRPPGAYTLQVDASFRSGEKPLSSCRWYRLTRGTQDSRICWSGALHLPLLILNSDNQVQWRVTASDMGPIAASVFEMRDEGFVRNDANEDIKGD